MPIAYVNATADINANAVGSTTSSGVLGWTPTNGNALLVTVSAWHGVAASVTGVTDNRGNTYALVYDSGALSTNNRLYVYAAWNYSGSGAPTLTLASGNISGNFYTWGVSEWSGLRPSGLDASASAAATGNVSGTDASVAASVAARDANSLVLALMVYPQSGALAITTPSGYTALYAESDGANLGAQASYRITSALETASASWSHANSTTPWGAAVVVLSGARGVGWTEGSGTVLASDEVDGAQFQRQKLTHGADGTATDASVTAPLPVSLPAIASGGATAHRAVSVVGTNGAAVKASPAVLYGVIATNTNSSPRYVKLYDRTTAPSVGTNTPFMTIPVNRISQLSLGQGITFATGLAIGMTTGAADSDTGGVAADEVVVTLYYR